MQILEVIKVIWLLKQSQSVFNNGIILCWGKSNHTGRKEITLPISYSTSYSSIAINIDWTANAAYSICSYPEVPSTMTIDKWYNNGVKLAGRCCYMTIGY